MIKALHWNTSECVSRYISDLDSISEAVDDTKNVFWLDLDNRDSPVFYEHIIVYFRDIYDHITRLTDTLDLYRGQLSSTMDANLAVASSELNKVMRTLTATSIILMGDVLIAGIYGMNFDYMPELHWHFGYFGALGLMTGITFLLVLFFKRLRWL